ncbi:MAG: tetratricopeptide repeat protein [Luteibaculum sp.]
MEFSEDFNEAQELEMALEKFESMLKSREEVFFDVEEIELVVDHFIDNQNNNRAKKAISVGCSQHPYSLELKIKEAEVLLASGKSTQALDSLLKLAAIERSNVDILMLISGIYSRQKNHLKAIEFLTKALSNADETESEDIYFDLGLELEYSGKFEDALEIFKEILTKSPENDAVGYELLYCYSELDKCEEAVSFFNEFVDNNPYSFLGWYNLGISYSKINLFEKAALAFDYCTLIEPEVSLPYYQKAFMYLESGDYRKALETYQDCMETDENSAILYTYVGECHEKLDEYQEAIQSYAKAIELDENLADAWLGIGVVYDLIGDTEQGIPYLRKAAELNNAGDYVLVYCEALTKAGQFDEAESIYKALETKEDRNTSYWLDYSNLHAECYGLESALYILDKGNAKINSDLFATRKAALLFKFGMTAEGTLLIEDLLESNAFKYEDFLDYYPDGEKLSLLSELIDLHKNFR